MRLKLSSNTLCSSAAVPSVAASLSDRSPVPSWPDAVFYSSIHLYLLVTLLVCFVLFCFHQRISGFSFRTVRTYH